MAVIATFVAGTENANAQNESELLNRIQSTLDKMDKQKSQKLLDLTAQKTYFYDKDVLAVNFGNGEKNFVKKIRRNPTSGLAGELKLGGIQMAENFSPAAFAGLTFAGKRFESGAGMGLAISKYNDESDKAGQFFPCPIAYADLGVVILRFPMRGFDNQGKLSTGYRFMYVFDKNHNKNAERTYETATEIVTTSDFFAVEGNSMAHCWYFKAIFSLKHLGCSYLGVEVYGGLYNRYYEEGSRKKALVGASVTLGLSGAKKRVDNNVVELQYELEQYNEYINQMRANQ